MAESQEYQAWNSPEEISEAKNFLKKMNISSKIDQILNSANQARNILKKYGSQDYTLLQVLELQATSIRDLEKIPLEAILNSPRTEHLVYVLWNRANIKTVLDLVRTTSRVLIHDVCLGEEDIRLISKALVKFHPALHIGMTEEEIKENYFH